MDNMQPEMIIDHLGDKVWYVNGGPHRIDGPAIEYADGRNSWYLHNEKLTFETWLNKNRNLTDEVKVMMKLQYG
jgi:hypothetical protein